MDVKIGHKTHKIVLWFDTPFLRPQEILTDYQFLSIRKMRPIWCFSNTVLSTIGDTLNVKGDYALSLRHRAEGEQRSLKLR